MNWHRYPETKPKLVKDFPPYYYSEQVLFTDGKHRWLGYFVVFKDQYDREETWKEAGRDGYTVDEKITHWMEAPELP